MSTILPPYRATVVFPIVGSIEGVVNACNDNEEPGENSQDPIRDQLAPVMGFTLCKWICFKDD